MKIVMVSNYFNHHQAALSDALYEKTGNDYLFISTRAMPVEREQMGWKSRYNRSYLLTEPSEERIQQILEQSDVVIAGDAPQDLFRESIRNGKLIFRYSERPLKNGNEWMKFLPRYIRWHHNNPASAAIYLLSASGYAPVDYGKFGLFRNKAYKWGYFPNAKTYPDIDDLFAKKDKTRMLWCGRGISWKHPEDAVKIAEKMRSLKLDFALEMVGPVDDELVSYVRDNEMSSYVRFSGPLSPQEARLRMEKAGIFLSTSDFQEGWGAVVNEAMNSGCAVVASHAVGAVPYLIRHEENGSVYRYGDLDSAADSVARLLRSPEKQEMLGRRAYETISNEWNADTAAERLLKLADRILFRR